MDRFEKDIREKLQQYEVDPPLHVWDAIENKLDKKQAMRPLWFKMAAAIAFLIISAASWVFLMPGFDQKELVTENATTDTPSTNDVMQTELQPTVIRETITPEIEEKHTPIQTSDFLIAQLENTRKNSFITSENLTETPLNDESRFSLANVMLLPVNSYTGDLLHSATGQIFIPSEIQTIPILTAADKSLLIASNNASGNDHSAKNLGLTAYLTPQQSFRYQRNTASIPFETLESEMLSFAAGINVNFKVSKRLEIQTGAGYNQIGQLVNNIAAFSHPSMTNLYTMKGEMINNHPQSLTTSMGGVTFTDQSFYFADIASSRIFTLKGSYDESNVNLLNKSSFGLIQQFGYLEIPLVMKYKIIDRLISLSVKSGIAANILVSNNVFLQGSAYSNAVGESVGINPVSVSGTGGLALSYPLGNRISLSLEPTFNMFITPISQINNIETHPYSHSLYMGIRYNL